MNLFIDSRKSRNFQSYDLGTMPSFSYQEVAGFALFSVKELILGWKYFPLRKKGTKLWWAAPFCLLWAIWKERNKIVFEDALFSLDRLKSFFLHSKFLV